MKLLKIMSAQRLDKFLQEKFPQYSRAFIKEQIKLGNFLVYPEQSRGVNGEKVKPSYILRQGDQVALAPGFNLPDAAQILPNPAIKLDIIFENDDVIVINKPAGLSVHPRQDKNGLPLLQEINTALVSGLLAYYPAITDAGDILNPPRSSLKGGSKISSPPLGGVRPKVLEGGDFYPANIRPGIVHRLDKDTSGVMIIAKNQASFDWLKKQFKERQTTKKYLALVHGLLKIKEGEIKTLLHRAVSDPTKQKVSKNEGKEAITGYKVIKEFKGYSLIEASPKTGRLHQIRVHLAHLSHPVAGDAKYGDKRLPILPGLDHQFLHAQELKITLPGGSKKTFFAPLPADLQATLDTLAGK
ncbi:MAG: RluA family pseudouridine synthase [Candidatus Portnoybacteria bacterium]|nr:RluA family pseudouridine synthase [Candidatus Portnoybacteria bacterium]MDD4982808.1 RluA family pseudouridine synthase [Candidatus Portnoybacteria bacterium]